MISNQTFWTAPKGAQQRRVYSMFTRTGHQDQDTNTLAQLTVEMDSAVIQHHRLETRPFQLFVIVGLNFTGAPKTERFFLLSLELSDRTSKIRFEMRVGIAGRFEIRSDGAWRLEIHFDVVW